MDAESIRTETEEAAYIYDADDNTVEKIRSLNDVEINKVIHMNINDGFWEIHDSMKADAIRDLVDKYQDDLFLPTVKTGGVLSLIIGEMGVVNGGNHLTSLKT